MIADIIRVTVDDRMGPFARNRLKRFDPSAGNSEATRLLDYGAAQVMLRVRFDGGGDTEHFLGRMIIQRNDFLHARMSDGQGAGLVERDRVQ